MDLVIEVHRKMLQNFAGSGHPIFRCTSALERGELRSKGGGMTSIHLKGGNTLHHVKWTKKEILTQPPVAEVQANEERQGNLLQEYEQRFEKWSEDQMLSRLCSEAGLRSVGIGRFFYDLPSPRDEKINHCAENIRCLEIKKELG